MILSFWREKPLDKGLKVDSMKTRCSYHHDLMVENSPFATPRVECEQCVPVPVAGFQEPCFPSLFSQERLRSAALGQLLG